MRLLRRTIRSAPVPVRPFPNEGDRVWIRSQQDMHVVVDVTPEGVMCMNLEHPASRVILPASWLRPVPGQTAGWWSK